ncbi:hypothetical protein T265_04352 [Opisthorchis viverrini]|uniref:Uncharacterized protein n=1 Tax=Opisthorchis viverrini TaxID=6198 RepID=A0A074ZNA5_OPIVI|nr:hypothetical protein T265_04352 [Opisthorchis viverrini]KER28883.1 hypothetical protein T265_04352 [Opisthorchis viverrini]
MLISPRLVLETHAVPAAMSYSYSWEVKEYMDQTNEKNPSDEYFKSDIVDKDPFECHFSEDVVPFRGGGLGDRHSDRLSKTRKERLRISSVPEAPTKIARALFLSAIRDRANPKTHLVDPV